MTNYDILLNQKQYSILLKAKTVHKLYSKVIDISEVARPDDHISKWTTEAYKLDYRWCLFNTSLWKIENNGDDIFAKQAIDSNGNTLFLDSENQTELYHYIINDEREKKLKRILNESI